VFGRRAGRHAAEKSEHIELGKLSLQHVASYNQLLQEQGIISNQKSPMLLPDYRFEKALPTVKHIQPNIIG
jgi:succinate dehydrogenase / fumarate reductase flavoprotein subunit